MQSHLQVTIWEKVMEEQGEHMECVLFTGGQHIGDKSGKLKHLISVWFSNLTYRKQDD
jgi:hypothetical protein